MGNLLKPVLALLLFLAWAGSAGALDDDTVEVDLLNAGSEPLRCVTVLAHFVSLPAQEVAAGETLEFSFFRGRDDGSLYVLRDDGRRMMIENLICGAAGDWDASRGEVPLLTVRSAAGRHVAFSCRIAQRLECQENG